MLKMLSQFPFPGARWAAQDKQLMNEPIGAFQFTSHKKIGPPACISPPARCRRMVSKLDQQSCRRCSPHKCKASDELGRARFSVYFAHLELHPRIPRSRLPRDIRATMLATHTQYLFDITYFAFLPSNHILKMIFIDASDFFIKITPLNVFF